MVFVSSRQLYLYLPNQISIYLIYVVLLSSLYHVYVSQSQNISGFNHVRPIQMYAFKNSFRRCASDLYSPSKMKTLSSCYSCTLLFSYHFLNYSFLIPVFHISVLFSSLYVSGMSSGRYLWVDSIFNNSFL